MQLQHPSHQHQPRIVEVVHVGALAQCFAIHEPGSAHYAGQARGELRHCLDCDTREHFIVRVKGNNAYSIAGAHQRGPLFR
jgi:hypothetical protein